MVSAILAAVVSEMTYTVSSGTLNSSIPYHTILAARHRTFVLVVASLFVLFVFLCTINFFFFFSTKCVQYFYRSQKINSDRKESA